MKKLINNHLIMNINQYGFRKGTGTDTAIATIYKTIAVSQEKKEHCVIIIIMPKHKQGIRQNLAQWFEI